MKLSQIMTAAAAAAGTGLAVLGLVTMFNGVSGNTDAVHPALHIAGAMAGMALGMAGGYKAGTLTVTGRNRTGDGAPDALVRGILGALLLATPAAVGGYQSVNYLFDNTGEPEEIAELMQDKARPLQPVNFIT